MARRNLPQRRALSGAISPENAMNRRHCLSHLAAAAAIAGLPTIAVAQGTPQTMSVVKVDIVQVANGYRATKFIGQTVVNDDGDTIGKVDDLIITNKTPFVVLSVGGFLGVGTRLVALPYDTFKVTDKKLMLRDATRDTLKAMPEFRYDKD
jgi:hypothetical protein